MKLSSSFAFCSAFLMPPTRGHDLKPLCLVHLLFGGVDAPHTGARLETCSHTRTFKLFWDAPHTGARLETSTFSNFLNVAFDAPHTGARLETIDGTASRRSQSDAPHTGARLETRFHLRPIALIRDAPHTGARLETIHPPGHPAEQGQMPPTRGHDLKQKSPGYHLGG